MQRYNKFVNLLKFNYKISIRKFVARRSSGLQGSLGLCCPPFVVHTVGVRGENLNDNLLTICYLFIFHSNCIMDF